VDVKRNNLILPVTESTTPAWTYSVGSVTLVAETTNIGIGTGNTKLYLNNNFGWRLGDNFAGVGNKSSPLVFFVNVIPTPTFISNNANGTANDTALIRIYAAFLRLEYSPVNISEFWAKCDGKKFGAYIDAVGRSNSYSENDLIEDPVFICEDIMRSHTTFIEQEGDIDVATFDSAANANVQARINLHSDNEMSAAAAIQNLAIQSTFAFCVSAYGRARAIALNDSTPTVNKYILWHQVLGGKISLSQTEEIYNSMEVNSRFYQEQGSFADVEIFENADSITANGEQAYVQSWPNIVGPPDGTGDASVKTVTDLLITDATSLMARAHKVVQFTLIDTFGIDLEPGDWIEFNSDSFDPRFLFYGVTWANLEFLVTAVSHEMTGTKVTALQLYA
jgi:hypothetical protein